jgi:leucyl/phenylalanyl-tRNA--protein transferase
MIPWLAATSTFPECERALAEPNGLLCAGGDLSPARLIDAYRRGIFPWTSAGEPLLWWSPDPRMVLVPAALKISRSLRRVLRAGGYRVGLDGDFAAVIRACAETPRRGQPGTWITPEMQYAYTRLFELGLAHCVEVFIDDRLVGGLYGVAIGKMFYGESMFSRASNASKIALAHLCRFLDENGCSLIDCQMKTGHLASLGAHEIPRADFLRRLRELTALDAPPARWPLAGAIAAWD